MSNRVFEVFTRRKAGDAFEHVGDVEAPDPETALLVAKEHYVRRHVCAGLWVVDRADVYEAPWDETTLGSGHEKAYRRSTSFKSGTQDILTTGAGS